MARVVKVLLVVVVLAAAGSWLFYFQLRRSAEATLRDFFALAVGGSDARLLEALHPGLDGSFDRRLVAQWVRAMVRERGAFTGLVEGGGEYSVEVSTEAGTRQRYEGKIGFEKGPLELELDFLDGRLVTVSTKDPEAVALLVHADKPPSDILPYVERGLAFWRHAFSPEPAKAFALMFPGLQELLGGPDSFAARMQGSGRVGKLDAVDFLGVDPGDRPDTATYRFECRFGAEVVPARVGFWFKSLQSHLVSFDL